MSYNDKMLFNHMNEWISRQNPRSAISDLIDSFINYSSIRLCSSLLLENFEIDESLIRSSYLKCQANIVMTRTISLVPLKLSLFI